MKYLFSFLLFIFAAASAYSQPAQRSDQQKELNLYPVHVSHLLNDTPEMRMMMMLYPDQLAQKKSKKVADEIGDEQSFWMYSFTLEDYEQIEFRLMRKGDVSQIWFAIDEINNGNLDEAVADSMFKSLEVKSNSNSFNPDKGIVELSNEIFGNTPDKDNDNLTDFLVANIKDGWLPDCECGYTAGFFNSVDQFFKTTAIQSGARSNERDILYIDSYPGITVNEVTNASRPLSTLAHEYQHLIHFEYNFQFAPEYTFVNEAQSNFASLLNGYFPHPSYGDYLADTNVPLFRWNRSGDVLPDYGRAASFTAYLWDQLGFEKAGFLTQSSRNGVMGIEAALQLAGSDLTFGQLLVNWGIANLVNDRELTGNPAYGYAHPFLSDLTASGFPIEDPFLVDKNMDVQQGGIAYLGFKLVKNLNLSVDFSNPSGEVRLITKTADSIDVKTLQNGEEFKTPENVEYEDVYLMFVNTQPGENEQADTETINFSTSVSTYEVTSTAIEDNTQPASYQLEQNYPNPFNPSTTINFSIPEVSEVSLTIYNYTGKKVATLVNNQVAAGSHSVTWNAIDMASGVYIYKIKAGNFIETKRMILLK